MGLNDIDAIDTPKTLSYLQRYMYWNTVKPSYNELNETR